MKKVLMILNLISRLLSSKNENPPGKFSNDESDGCADEDEDYRSAGTLGCPTRIRAGFPRELSGRPQHGEGQALALR